LKGNEEIQVDHWLIGNRTSQHVRVYDDTYTPSEGGEGEDDVAPLVSES